MPVAESIAAIAALYSAYQASQSAGDGGSSGESNAFNADQAALQRDWERENYRYRHTWEVEDLRRAGLNPILSAGGQPPVAQGASAQAVSPDYNREDRKTRRLEAMMMMANSSASIAKMLAETRLTKEGVNTQKSQQVLNAAQAQAALRNSGGYAGLPFGMLKVPFQSAFQFVNSARGASDRHAKAWLSKRKRV